MHPTGLKLSLLLPLAVLTSTPDEGQWLPQQIRQMNWPALEARGMELTRDEFWHPTKGGVLSAAVQINGCSASFVSSDGLVVTNHHCGFGAVNALSTPEQNYLRDGFVAGTREQELPAPGMVVYVVRRIEDVTEKVHAAQARARTPLQRHQITQQVIQQLVDEGEKQPNTTCSVASFFEGREYNLYYRTRLTDVRLVYAPPRAVGEFGGDVDNWEWPRHTGDFTFFRAYAAPDGSPRDYSKDNVPFRPEHFLKVSRDGVQEDDMVIIMGYPGRTERYLTSVAVADREGVYYPKRLDVLTQMIDVLQAYGSTSDAAQLEVASLQKSLANVQKNASGMIWGLARNGVVDRKMREERAFTKWVQASPDRQQRFGNVLDRLKQLDEKAAKTSLKDLILGLGLSSRINPFLSGLVTMVGAADTMDEGSAPLLAFAARKDLTANFEQTQRQILTIVMDEFRYLSGTNAIEGRELLKPELDIPTKQLVDDMLRQTKLMSAEARVELAKGGKEAVRNSEDPLVKLALALAKERAAAARRQQESSGARLDVGRAWISAQQEWRGTSFYPDANSTMRVSIASVKAYEPRDGVTYTPHTTVAGILSKETGEEPFASPKALLKAADSRGDSRYFDGKIGDVPVCFLSDGDTTGGNSGSPVVNGKGELVGLNFDRVFENVSGDYGWNADRSRNISVDIRFVLWNLESVMPAHHLLEEMGVK